MSGANAGNDAESPVEEVRDAFFNEPQLLAIQTTDRPVLVLAPPGTGKTLILQQKFVRFHDKYGPGSCAAIAFTNQAAKEIKDRIRREGIPMDGRVPNSPGSTNASLVGTFHGVGMKVLQDASRLGLYTGPLVRIEAQDQEMIAYQCLQRAGDGTKMTPAVNEDRAERAIRDLTKAVSRIKNSGWFPVKGGYGRPDGRFETIVKGLPNPSSGQHASALAYHNALWEAQVLDYDDILIQSTAVLQGYREQIMPNLKAVIIDEYQDANTAQEEFVLAISRDIHLTCCGDDDQSIYGWRGARLENILTFEARHPNTLVVSMQDDFRSPQEIIDAAYRLKANNKVRLQKPKATAMASDKLSDHKAITIHDYVSRYQLYSPSANGFEEGLVHFTAQVCRDIAQTGAKLSEMTCLVRNNKEAQSIRRVLAQMNMPARVTNQDTVRSLELRRLTAWLRLLTNQNDISATSTLCDCGTTNQAFADITHAARQARQPVASYIADAVAAGRIKHKRHFTDFAEAYRRFSNPDLRADLVGLLSQLADYETTRPHRSMKDEQHSQFWTIFASLTLVLQESPRLGSALDYLMNGSSDGDLAEGEADVIDVCTIHKVKGRQKKVVVISAFADGIMPSSIALRAGRISAQMEEERRLAFVALTRASQSVHIITVNKAQSTFLNEIGAVRPTVPEMAPPPALLPQAAAAV